jgi:2-succinyl-5-enolpyruvyl-6-hydroxy-3-cyclohexene-1-carboxylate synthase
MGTLCNNCPFNGVKRTEGSCTELFAKKFHNSCVTYDISKHQFLKELNEFEKQMKTEVREMTEEEQKEFNDAVQHINEEMPKTDTLFQELPSDVKNVPLKEEKPKMTRKASPKKASAKKVKKEITEEIKSETNDENTVTD